METTRTRLAKNKLSACGMMRIATGDMLLFFSPDIDGQVVRSEGACPWLKIESERGGCATSAPHSTLHRLGIEGASKRAMWP